MDAITERETKRRQQQAHGAREKEMRMMVEGVGHPQCERVHPPEGTRQPQDGVKLLACEVTHMVGPDDFIGIARQKIRRLVHGPIIAASRLAVDGRSTADIKRSPPPDGRIASAIQRNKGGYADEAIAASPAHPVDAEVGLIPGVGQARPRIIF